MSDSRIWAKAGMDAHVRRWFVHRRASFTPKTRSTV